MAGIDLRYYDQLTDTWIAPLANGEDLDALQVLITQLGQDVETAEQAVADAVSDVNAAVTTVENMEQTVTNLSQGVTQLGEEVATHWEDKNNPHNVTPIQIGAVRKTGDTMTGLLTVPSLYLPLGTRFQESEGVRTVINAHNDRMDFITQDGTKHLFRWEYGDFKVYDEKGVLIDSFKSIRDKFNRIRKTYVLFEGMLTSGSANLTLPSGFANLDAFDEIVVSGLVGGSRHSALLIPSMMVNAHVFDMTRQMTYTASAIIDVFWLSSILSKSTSKIEIRYNRNKIGNANAIDTTENGIQKIVGVKYG